MSRQLLAIMLVTGTVLLAGGCAAGTSSRPLEGDALEKLAAGEAIATSLAADAVGGDAVGQWEREFFDDACTMTCSACDTTNSEMVLVGEFSAEQLMTTMEDAAASAGGSADDVEEIGSTLRMHLDVSGHRIDVVLRGRTGIMQLTTGCYQTASQES